MTAAVAMLDEPHRNHPNLRGDSNVYTLGSMAGHNVVIVSPARGKMGLVAAAALASALRIAYPSIIHGLLVGVGAGLPDAVQLGDVIINTSVDGYPGVIQWDYGKAQDGEFNFTGVLNGPCIALTKASTKLETEPETGEDAIPIWLEELGSKKRHLADGSYTRKDNLQDIVFPANCPCQSPSSTKGNKRRGTRVTTDSDSKLPRPDDRHRQAKCDRSRAIQRPLRPTKIHYGLIASGSQVVKDASLRDQINECFEHKVLCIEMEAAGVMDVAPFLVVRGICDYADSHKNKAWQNYAAMVAAVVAKMLLCRLPETEDEPSALKAHGKLCCIGRKGPETVTGWQRRSTLTIVLLQAFLIMRETHHCQSTTSTARRCTRRVTAATSR